MSVLEAFREARMLFTELAGFVRSEARSWVITGFVLAALTGSAHARHEGLDALIARADRAVAAEPERGELWLARAELHRLHDDLPRACRDLARAATEVEPAPPARVALSRARLLLGAGDAELARAAAEASVVLAPQVGDGWLTLGDCLIELRRLDGAACAYEHASVVGDLNPGEVLTLVEIHVRREDPQSAIDVLDRAIARLGPVAALLLASAEQEAALGRFDRALTAVDRVAAKSVRQEHWLAMRGDLLVRAGRPDEAVPVYQAAERALARVTRRRTRAHVELEQHLREVLARIASPQKSPQLPPQQESPR